MGGPTLALRPEEEKMFEGQPRGFPFGDFDLADVMLPDGDDMGIPSDAEEEEEEMQTESGFANVLGERGACSRRPAGDQRQRPLLLLLPACCLLLVAAGVLQELLAGKRRGAGTGGGSSSSSRKQRQQLGTDAGRAAGKQQEAALGTDTGRGSGACRARAQHPAGDLTAAGNRTQ